MSPRACCCWRIWATTPIRACSRAGHDETRALYPGDRPADRSAPEVRARALCRPAAVRRRPGAARGVAAARLVLAGDAGGAAHAGAARELSRRLARGPAEAPQRAGHAGAVRFPCRQPDAAARPHRHRRLRPARFPGRGDRAARPSIWCRCCRTCAATCRRELVDDLRERYLAAFPDLDREAFDISLRRDRRPAQHAHPRHLHPPAAARRQIRLSAASCRAPGGMLETDLAHPALAPVRAWFDSPPAPRPRGVPPGIVARSGSTRAGQSTI